MSNSTNTLVSVSVRIGLRRALKRGFGDAQVDTFGSQAASASSTNDFNLRVDQVVSGVRTQRRPP